MKLGDKGIAVEDLQVQLNLVMANAFKGNFEPLEVDGDFGRKTESAFNRLIAYWGGNTHGQTGSYDNFVEQLAEQYSKLPRFVVVVDAGHGGIDPNTGVYTTPPENGKRYTHKGARLHFGKEVFYEGLSNRFMAAGFVDKLKAMGILVVKCYHPYLDWWGTNSNGTELMRRANYGMPYCKRGFVGLYHSFHSNAAGSSSMTQEQIDKIRGGIVFTGIGKTVSDKAAKLLLQEWIGVFGDNWCRFLDENKNGLEVATEDSDYEENFGVLRESERMAKAFGNDKWAAILQEAGFFTSRPEAEWLIQENTIELFVDCAVRAALKYMGIFFSIS
jgi:N-acetylmuramoyl-L-alanine amidase